MQALLHTDAAATRAAVAELAPDLPPAAVPRH
jgi:hypothetical protein